MTTLVVCSANICRSPTAAFALSQFSRLSIQSAGIRPVTGANICQTAAHQLSEIPGGSEYAGEFSSQGIETVDLRSFELILTATGSIRGKLVQQNPGLRGRIFTLLESRHLAERALSSEECTILNEGGMSQVLVRRRGTLPTQAPTRRWLRGRSPSPLDLIDTHGTRSQRKHEKTIAQALAVGYRLGESLTSWCATPEA
ncbi:arsenate reductase/protein-tyrosine-phosphatase family protein [Arthrobacter rhombi]|uniref:arsenate reductase/protein-tyrosine-phosphatase family protein n=1 Tax=Arthrobacter rhombi TaxID=71253 RepID=UPI00130458C7